jgi:NAD(P)-dependent dehydrogenase (short-subunit alcohol dehydrogenase family)
LRARAAGTIVTCAGGGALFPMEGAHATAYAAAKAGVCRLTDQLALEVRHEGMRVNCLLPGPTWDEERLRAVEAEERASGRPHPGRAMNRAPEEAAELALFLASEASAPLSGRIVSVDDEWWRDPERVRAVQADLHAYCLRRREPA